MIRKLFNALTGLPDDIVEEAAGYEGAGRRKRRFRGGYRILIAAALVCLIIILAVIHQIKGGGSADLRNDMLLLQVSYPMAYSYEDTHERIKRYDGNPVEEAFYQSVRTFTYETACELFAEGENICYSPVSLYYALAAAAQGAEGRTAKELFMLLGVGDKDDLSGQCHNLYNRLFKDNEMGKLLIRNSIWLDDSISVNDDYIARLAEEYYSESYYGDFADESMARTISDWIEENTGGMESVQEPDPGKVLSIINAINYSDQWIMEFDSKNTMTDVFYKGDGSTVECEFMNDSYGIHVFSVGKNYTRSMLALKNGGEMVFVLPAEGVDIHELVGTTEGLAEVLEGGESYYGEVVWKLPKFSYESGLELAGMLKKLGVTECFSSAADFSGIGTVEGEGNSLYIDSVIQNTQIAIDEKGVTASAYTQVVFDGGAIPDGRAEMLLDRPFLYAVVDSNGVVIFIGICDNPV